jgi:hypothetical protein
MCALALLMAFGRGTTRELASDAMVVRALGVTIEFSGFMLARVALQASAGNRRAVALLIAAPLLVAGTALLVSPGLLPGLFQKGYGLVIPWAVALPGLASLALSRWRVG